MACDASSLAVIQEEAVRQYPNEACGLIVAMGKKSVAIPCRNVSTEPRHTFLLDPSDYGKAADQGEVIGVWHTHVETSPQPSQADRVGCENSELPWFIVAVRKTDEGFVFEGPEMIEPSGYEVPYLERPYVFGAMDCWSLVRDYYRREYGIALGDYLRTDRFWANGRPLFDDNWEREGFVRLVGQPPKEGDLFLMQTDKEGACSHIAIYIGNDMILHHCHGRLSRRDVFGGSYWQRHTVHHLRHKTKC